MSCSRTTTQWHLCCRQYRWKSYPLIIVDDRIIIGQVLKICPNPTKLTQYSKTCVKRPLSKRPKIDFQIQLSLNAGQKYCRMLQSEHSAVLLIFIKLPFVIKNFVLFIFEWPFYTGFTVLVSQSDCQLTTTQTLF